MPSARRPRRSPAAPSLPQLAARVDELARQVAALARREAEGGDGGGRDGDDRGGAAGAAGKGSARRRGGRGTGAEARGAAPGSAAATRDDLLQLLERLRAAAGPEPGGRRGPVVYGGSLELDGREYLWAMERPLAGLLALDPEGPAQVLATLAHPQRLRLLLALVEQPRTAAELQRVIGSRSPGPLYHHLRDLLALGVVAQHDRRYAVPARHVVPLLAALAAAIDLGATRGGGS